MATSGTINGTTVAPSEGSYLDWQLISQNTAGNYSTIHWQAGWRYPAVTCRGLRLGKAIINGATVYDDHDAGDGVHTFSSSHLTSSGDHTPKLQTASGSLNIAHNTDGTKTFSLSITMTGFDSPFLVSAGSGSFSLPAIPRFSSAPSTPVISAITSTSVVVTFTDGTGGAAIDARYISYGTDPTGTTVTTVSSDGSDTISGLTPGTVYYFWAYTHNVAGNSPRSARATATTLSVPAAPSMPVISGISQVSATVFATPNFDGGSAITDYELGFGSVDSEPDFIIPAVLPKTVNGLDPGTRYYFWIRAINAVGTGPWSVPATALTIAGARIKVGSVWKTAIPYVRVGGVWKLARPWVRKVGIWKESQ